MNKECFKAFDTWEIAFMLAGEVSGIELDDQEKQYAQEVLKERK